MGAAVPRRGVSELTTAILLILITVAAAAIIFHGWLVYSSREASTLEHEKYSSIVHALTHITVAYAYLELTQGADVLHVFLAVSGRPVKLLAVYIEGAPMAVESVSVRGDANETLPGLPVELKPGIYELVIRGVAPQLPEAATAVPLRLSFDVKVVDCEAVVVQG